jgi:hypothetical protein
MTSNHFPHQTPRQRLLRLETTSPPFRPTVRSPIYLTGIGLLLLMLMMVVAGVLLATLGSELLAPYLQRIQEMSSPLSR